MSTKAGVGYSTHRHYKAAAIKAVKMAFAEAGITQADLVIVFAAIAHPQETLITEIHHLTNQAPLIGCSGCGLIAGPDAIEEAFFLGVMVIQSNELRFSVASATGMAANPEPVGHAIGRALADQIDDETRCLITLVDGLTLNFERYREGLAQGLEARGGLPVFGGAAADDWKMQKTYQYINDQVLSDGAVAFSISGAADLSHAVNHGCMVLGEARKITRASANVIHEIDGQPAHDILRPYLNEDEKKDRGKIMVNLNLGFRSDENSDDLFVRYMPMWNEATGAITIPTEAKTGESIWVMRRDPRLITQGGEVIADQVSEQLAGRQPKFVLHFDCGGRGKLILRDQEKQHLLRQIQKKVGPSAPWLGLYTYGEIGPLQDRNCFHNYSLVLLAVA